MYCPFSSKDSTVCKSQGKDNVRNGEVNKLNSVIISRVVRILASKNRFQSHYDETFNIDSYRSDPFPSDILKHFITHL